METVASSEGFTAVPLAGGRMLGLWRKTVVKPEPQGGVGGFEIGVMVPGDNGVADRYASLQGAGHDILQPLTTMDFGPTFVIRDPDGHRVRFCQPDA